MKKKIAIILLTMILLTSCMATLCACENEEPRHVKLELVNPITGEIIKEGDTIDLPTEKTPFEVRVKDKQTGEYLTDDDIPENTIKGSCSARFTIWSSDNKQSIPLYTYGYWPSVADIQYSFYYDHYEVNMYFNCEPKNLRNDSDYKRKYYDASQSISFYINK